jgi:DNA-directed RNA polymerase subunit H
MPHGLRRNRPTGGVSKGDCLTELIEEEDLRFNVLNHDIVPQHMLLAEEDVATLLEKYQIVKEQLPKIKSSDPAVKVIHAKVGDVVQVIRPSPTAGTFTAFRLVVEAL